MKVGEIMANIMQVFARDDSLYRAVKTMKIYDIGRLLANV